MEHSKTFFGLYLKTEQLVMPGIENLDIEKGLCDSNDYHKIRKKLYVYERELLFCLEEDGLDSKGFISEWVKDMWQKSKKDWFERDPPI